MGIMNLPVEESQSLQTFRLDSSLDVTHKDHGFQLFKQPPSRLTTVGKEEGEEERTDQRDVGMPIES
jgi:hypothetical protein